MQILNNTDNQGIKSLSKERRKTLETYQQLFYLLQVRIVAFTKSFGLRLYSLAVVYNGSFPNVKLQSLTCLSMYPVLSTKYPVLFWVLHTHHLFAFFLPPSENCNYSYAHTTDEKTEMHQVNGKARVLEPRQFDFGAPDSETMLYYHYLQRQDKICRCCWP